MKMQKTLKELTIEELNTRAKQLKLSNTVLIVCVIIMAVAGLYLVTKKGISFNTFLPIFFLPLVVINYMNLKKVTDEIASRK
jgi:hypothetical protein